MSRLLHFTPIDSSIKLRLENSVPLDGSCDNVLSTDANDFTTGIAFFQAGSSNLPNNNTQFLVISGGDSNTVVQIAFSIWNLQTPQARYKSGGTWSSWSAIKTS